MDETRRSEADRGINDNDGGSGNRGSSDGGSSDGGSSDGGSSDGGSSDRSSNDHVVKDRSTPRAGSGGAAGRRTIRTVDQLREYLKRHEKGASESRQQDSRRQESHQQQPLVVLDAPEIHKRIVSLNRLCEEARLEMLKYIAILDEGRLFIELGYGTTRQYLVGEFGFSRTYAFELVRVARKLKELPTLTQALVDGEIRWSGLQEVSRVATTDSEDAWLELLKKHSLERVRHEVKSAIAEQRDTPRDPSEYGLSNLMSRIVLEYKSSEKEVVQTALRIVADSMGEGAPKDLESVVLFHCQQILEGNVQFPGRIASRGLEDPGASQDAVEFASSSLNEAGCEAETLSVPNRNSGHAVVYQQCPTCAASVIHTDVGPVRVDPEEVDRIADIAQTVDIAPHELLQAEPPPEGEIDKPNSASLARKVKLRDGLRCANPVCDERQHLQAHHVIFRIDGGPTALSNEVAVCRRCHTLIHSGLIRIQRNANGELLWVPKARELDLVSYCYAPLEEWRRIHERVSLDLGSELNPTHEMPIDGISDEDASNDEVTNDDSPDKLSAIVAALRARGVPSRRAEKVARWAFERVIEGSIPDRKSYLREVLRQAFRIERRRNRAQDRGRAHQTPRNEPGSLGASNETD